MTSLRHDTLLWFMAVLCAAMLPAPAQAGKVPPPPISWGTVPVGQLAMTTFSPDTSASAVILCDYCDIRVNDDLGITYMRHLRVKILNERGFVWGTHTIDTGMNGDFVSTIAGATYVLKKDGTIAVTPLEKGDIAKEELSPDRYRYTFTLPDLQPGCIVEIRYTIESSSLAGTRPWTFHNEEPVLWSEIRILSPKAFAYTGVAHGNLPFTIKEKTSVPVIVGGYAWQYFGRDIVENTLMRWPMESIPALRAEPYITSLEDHSSRVDIHLAGYSLPTGGVKWVASSWEALVKELMESDRIGGRFERRGCRDRPRAPLGFTAVTADDRG